MRRALTSPPTVPSAPGRPLGRAARRRRTTTGAAGLTLIEVLVALAVASLLALVLGHLLRSTRASAAAVTRTLDPVQLLDLAAELLAEEVSMAAHLPWPEPDAIDDLPAGVEAPSFVTPGLTIAAAPGGASLGIRYIDDSLASGPRARDVTFEAGLDSVGEPQLFRRAGTASRQPLVAGVESLEVTALVRAGSLVEPVSASPGATADAIVLRLRAGEAVRDVAIELPGRPVAELGP